MYILILIFSVLFLLSLMKTAFSMSEGYQEYLKYKSKCFDCEKQMIQIYGENGAWLANPAKSFSAEKEAVMQAGEDISNGFLAKTLRWY